MRVIISTRMLYNADKYGVMKGVYVRVAKDIAFSEDSTYIYDDIRTEKKGGVSR